MASHEGQPLQEIPVEGSAQSLVLESGASISGLDSGTMKMARVQGPMQAKERAPLRAAPAAKRMRLRTASVRGGRRERSRRVVLHGSGASCQVGDGFARWTVVARNAG